MGALTRALTDSGFLNIEAALNVHDSTSHTMRQCILAWFDEWMRRAPDEDAGVDPCQRIPYAVVTRLNKATFAEYDSTLNTKGEPIGKMAFIDGLRKNFDARKFDIMQWAMIGGECMVKPVPMADGHITWQVIRRDRYLVVGRAPDDTVTDIITAEKTAQGEKWYTLVERRTAGNDGRLTIQNLLFASTERGTLGSRVPLTSLAQYDALPERYTYLQPIWGVGLVPVRMPIANCVDGSADGVSVYEPAMGLIHNINRNEWQLDREFELGRARMVTSADLLTEINGKKTMHDDLFVGIDGNEANVGITTFAPALRGASYAERRQGYLKSVENLLGFKRGLLSDAQAVEKTATEITDSAGGYALTIGDLQTVYYDALRCALRLGEQIGITYRLCDGTAWDEDALAVTWGNGVLYDAAAEWQDRLTMVQSGMLRPELAIAWKFDLPCDTEADLQFIRTKFMPDVADTEV